MKVVMQPLYDLIIFWEGELMRDETNLLSGVLFMAGQRGDNKPEWLKKAGKLTYDKCFPADYNCSCRCNDFFKTQTQTSRLYLNL